MKTFQDCSFRNLITFKMALFINLQQTDTDGSMK